MTGVQTCALPIYARASHRRPSCDTNEHRAPSRRYTARLTAAGTQRLRRRSFTRPAATRVTSPAGGSRIPVSHSADVISDRAPPGGVPGGSDTLTCVASTFARRGFPSSPLRVSRSESGITPSPLRVSRSESGVSKRVATRVLPFGDRDARRPTPKRRASSRFTKLSSTSRTRLDRSFLGRR